jgi:hypothetical protein
MAALRSMSLDRVGRRMAAGHAMRWRGASHRPAASRLSGEGRETIERLAVERPGPCGRRTAFGRMADDNCGNRGLARTIWAILVRWWRPDRQPLAGCGPGQDAGETASCRRPPRQRGPGEQHRRHSAALRDRAPARVGVGSVSACRRSNSANGPPSCRKPEWRQIPTATHCPCMSVKCVGMPRSCREEAVARQLRRWATPTVGWRAPGDRPEVRHVVISRWRPVGRGSTAGCSVGWMAVEVRPIGRPLAELVARSAARPARQGALGRHPPTTNGLPAIGLRIEPTGRENGSGVPVRNSCARWLALGRGPMRDVHRRSMQRSMWGCGDPTALRGSAPTLWVAWRSTAVSAPGSPRSRPSGGARHCASGLSQAAAIQREAVVWVLSPTPGRRFGRVALARVLFEGRIASRSRDARHSRASWRLIERCRLTAPGARSRPCSDLPGDASSVCHNANPFGPVRLPFPAVESLGGHVPRTRLCRFAGVGWRGHGREQGSV